MTDDGLILRHKVKPEVAHDSFIFFHSSYNYQTDAGQNVNENVDENDNENVEAVDEGDISGN